MAKNKQTRESEHEGKVTTITTPSWMGSHASMVDKERTERLNVPGLVVCKDDSGLYITERRMLDNREADLHRCDRATRSKFSNHYKEFLV